MEELVLDYNIFGDVVKSYMEDSNVTNIEWNGKSLWVTDGTNGKYKTEHILDEKFVSKLCVALGDKMGVSLNADNPKLEADTVDRRISIADKSIAGATSFVIRRNELGLKNTRKTFFEENYCDEKVLNFLENCIIAHNSLFAIGLPDAGKTEFIRYLSQFIRNNEKAGVYEDSREFHYDYINPEKDRLELKIAKKNTRSNGKGIDYSEAVAFGLRHNVKWIILSEARGEESYDVIDAMSTGSKLLSTLHCDDVEYAPLRLFNMTGSKTSTKFLDTIYSNLDVIVLIEYDESTYKRKVGQIGLVERDEFAEVKNRVFKIYENGEWLINDISEMTKKIQKRFKLWKIENPFVQTTNLAERKITVSNICGKNNS